MPFNQTEIIEKANKALKTLSCQYAEIRCSKRIGTSITLSNNEIDSITAGESIAGSIRILNNGSWSFIAFNNIEELGSYAKRINQIAAVQYTEKSISLQSSKPVKKHFTTDVYEPFSSITMDEKLSVITSYNDILKNSEKIQTTRATYRDENVDYVYLNTEGSEITSDRSYCGISLSSVAKDGSVIQPFHESTSGYGGFELVRNHERMAERVIKTAVDMLSADLVDGGTYDIIIDPKLAGVFVHEAFGHLSEADFVHENKRMQEIMVLGSQFGPEELTIIDDGSIEKLPGYTPCDDEGILSRKNYLIKKGALTGRLHSRQTAASMNEETTGNARAISVMREPIVRMTNTYIENAPNSKEDIFSSMDNGIYACSVIGGQTNLEMFTFTAGYGYEIKNGKPGRMFRNIVLSGNVFSTLKNITMIGNDRKMFGGLGGCGKGGQSPLPVSFGGPHMLLKNVLIGGTQ